MLSFHFVLTALIATTALGRPFADSAAPDVGHISRPFKDGQKMDGEVTVITGIEEGRQEDGVVPIRREIRDLQQNFPDMWNLYLLGLRSMQLADQRDPLSFYQIAGIHGRPYVAWQNAEGIPGKRSGYCPHSNTMFFGWHRAYLALFEQELYKHVQNISSEFPYALSSRYREAAQDFRMPYWDWTLGDQNSSVPNALIDEVVEVTGTDGNMQTIENPLHHYRFHPTYSSDFDNKFLKYNTTIRWPSSALSAAQSQNDIMIAEFNSRARYMHETLAHGFAIAPTFNNFSLTHLEFIHGSIHFIVGGSRSPTQPTQSSDGHMWPLEYSAFEPIFMLHHCNVDRLYSLWLDAHPDSFLEPANITDKGTFAIPDYSIVDADTPLLPFWKTQTSFWTTNDVRNSNVLGYAYPETQWWNFASIDLYRTNVNATIAQLYSTEARDRLSKTDGTAIGGSLSHLNKDNSFTDWGIQATALPNSLPMSFQVKFSIVGAFYSDPVADVGTWTVLMPQEMERDRNVEPDGGKTEGSVSLTAALLDEVAAGRLEDLEPDMVVPFLTENLTWMVYSGDGTLIPSTKLGGLRIVVASSKVGIPKERNVPLKYSGPRTWHPEVTAGKGGGAGL